MVKDIELQIFVIPVKSSECVLLPKALCKIRQINKNYLEINICLFVCLRALKKKMSSWWFLYKNDPKCKEFCDFHVCQCANFNFGLFENPFVEKCEHYIYLKYIDLWT